jgi:hypothetical protein
VVAGSFVVGPDVVEPLELESVVLPVSVVVPESVLPAGTEPQAATRKKAGTRAKNERLRMGTLVW